MKTKSADHKEEISFTIIKRPLDYDSFMIVVVKLYILEPTSLSSHTNLETLADQTLRNTALAHIQELVTQTQTGRGFLPLPSIR